MTTLGQFFGIHICIFYKGLTLAVLTQRWYIEVKSELKCLRQALELVKKESENFPGCYVRIFSRIVSGEPTAHLVLLLYLSLWVAAVCNMAK